MSLTLITGNNNVMKAKCTVHIDNNTESFDDFITLGFNRKEGKIRVLHNCDILTILIGMDILAKTMTNMYDKMPQNEKDIVDNYIEENNKHEQNRNCDSKSISYKPSGDDVVLS